MKILGTILLALVSLQSPAADGPLPAQDTRWLERVTYGLDTGTVERYQSLGRKKFLEEQLHGDQADPALDRAVASLSLLAKPPEQLIQEAEAEGRRIQGLATEEAKQQARQAQNQLGNQIVYEASRRHLLRAFRSRNQLLEQMTWFWLNYFSVFQGKGNVRWMIADYEERAVRPHALGHFRDLLMATLTHPAMLAYLDNAQSAAGKINENYARELLELHTLGVAGGYGQQDVQELARVLTGVGIHAGAGATNVRAEWRPLLIRQGLFEFNPARHDFGEKTFLGQRLPGEGFKEAEKVVDILSAHPSTARFVSRRLGAYFLGAEPPQALVERMAREFLRSGGDIPAVLRVLALSKAFTEGAALKDPMHFVVSALRLAYDGKSPMNMKPVVNWLNQLGEPLYGRVTPDGYPAVQEAWSSPGQLVKRFEIARALGSGNAGLFDGDDGKPSGSTGFPQLASRLYYLAIEPGLSAATRQALGRANSQQEWNTFLLASPDFMMR